MKTTYYLSTLQVSNIEKSTIDVKKEVRGLAVNAASAAKTCTAEEKNVCCIGAMLSGGTCEDCQ